MLAIRVGKDSGPEVDPSAAIPAPKPGEALIRVLRAGVCNTDLEILKGYGGFTGVMGHEFVGEVKEVEENDRVKVGQRVVGEINLACNNCDYCEEGGVLKRNHCKEREVMGILKKDGTFAEYLTLPVQNLFVVPDSVSTLQAAFTEPLAAAFRIVEQSVVEPDHQVAVIGDGKLGLLITEVLSTLPCSDGGRLVLFGRHEDKMGLISSPRVERVTSDGVGGGHDSVFDVVVEASGSPSGLMMAATMTRPLGTVILKTTCAAGDKGFNSAPFVIKEITVLGSRCGNFPMALEAMATGAVRPEKLLTKEYPFRKAADAIKHAGTRGTLKIILNMEDVMENGQVH